ncbi:SHOCT domain-containing protein [Thiomicrorhabdus arctica]|jgi:putative membrane protein|uniref:SHOCT domain-containing protein n=1 Tax=Thiomicrorhabdus arctica TaxID=131540 RepID=UPI00035D0391|nr:SHOCT domain-containing protein [Thiomicrorhabdus arctica]
MNWNFEPFHGDLGDGMMVGMWVFWLIMLIAIIFIIKQFMAPSKPPESALELLEKRYAKGEINKDEFEEIKKTLLP